MQMLKCIQFGHKQKEMLKCMNWKEENLGERKNKKIKSRWTVERKINIIKCKYIQYILIFIYLLTRKIVLSPSFNCGGTFVYLNIY